MPPQISEIPTEKLLQDLSEGIEDENYCVLAMMLGIEEVSGISTTKRLITNRKINATIRTELDKRGVPHK